MTFFVLEIIKSVLGFRRFRDVYLGDTRNSNSFS